MAVGKVQVVEKNEGEKIEWRQKGTKLYFGDDDLILRCDTRQREYPVHEDICVDENGNLTLGEGKYYVAEVDIPPYRYSEPEPEEDAAEETAESEKPQAERNSEREILALNMEDVVLTLWSVEGLRYTGALN